MSDEAPEIILELGRVTKRFGGLIAVDAVSLSVVAGEVFGIIGPNGAGKTTLFNVIAGATRPDEGTIKFVGVDVTSASAPRMCELGLSRTFQNAKPFRSMTVLRNAMVGGIVEEERTPPRKRSRGTGAP